MGESGRGSCPTCEWDPGLTWQVIKSESVSPRGKREGPTLIIPGAHVPFSSSVGGSEVPSAVLIGGGGGPCQHVAGRGNGCVQLPGEGPWGRFVSPALIKASRSEQCGELSQEQGWGMGELRTRVSDPAPLYLPEPRGQSSMRGLCELFPSHDALRRCRGGGNEPVTQFPRAVIESAMNGVP